MIKMNFFALWCLGVLEYSIHILYDIGIYIYILTIYIYYIIMWCLCRVCRCGANVVCTDVLPMSGVVMGMTSLSVHVLLSTKHQALQHHCPAQALTSSLTNRERQRVSDRMRDTASGVALGL
jgi:hypothetical protein